MIDDLLNKIQDSPRAHRIIDAARNLGAAANGLTPEEFKWVCELGEFHWVDTIRQKEINQMLFQL